MSATVADRIASWWPNGMEPTRAVPAELADVRAIVAAAGPSEARPKDAVTVLRYCWEYLEYRRSVGLPTDPDAAFTVEAVDAYRETLTGATGTKAARCSYLKRLHPSVGLGGTTRTPAAATDEATEPASDADDRTVTALPTPPAAPSAANRRRNEAWRLGFNIEDLRPRLLHDAHWEPVAELTRHLVTETAPTRGARAQSMVTDVGYLAAWVNSQHRPLTPGVVLDGATIEAFLTLLLDGGRAPRGVASMAASLHAVREANGVTCDVVRRRFPPRARKAPYTLDEIDDFYRQVARIRSTQRRIQARAALSLMLGAGAAPGDAGWLALDAVIETSDGVTVGLGTPENWDRKWNATDTAVLESIERRWVAVADEYCEDILIAKEAARPDESPFLLGGNSGKRNERARSVLYGNGASSNVSADVDPTRARAVWLVEAAASGRYPVITDLLDAAGAETLARVEDVVDHIRERAAELNEQPVLFASLADLAKGTNPASAVEGDVDDESSAA